MHPVNAPDTVAGTPVPGMTGYVTATCGHPVDQIEWDAGFHSCHECGGDEKS